MGLRRRLESGVLLLVAHGRLSAFECVSSKAAKPSASKPVRDVRTVYLRWPSVWAICGIVWPRSDRRAISTRARAGVAPACGPRRAGSPRRAAPAATRPPMIVGLAGYPPARHPTISLHRTAEWSSVCLRLRVECMSGVWGLSVVSAPRGSQNEIRARETAGVRGALEVVTAPLDIGKELR